MPETEEFYTPEEIATFLKLKEDSVTRLLRQDKLPGYKVEGLWRINKSEFWAHMATLRNMQEPKDK